MRACFPDPFLGLLLLATAVASAQVEMVNPTAISVSAGSSFDNSGLFDADNTLDSEFDEGNRDGALGTHWLAADGVLTETITFDLGIPQNLTALRILNTSNTNWNDSETDRFTIEVSTDDGASFSVPSEPVELRDFDLGFQEVPLFVPGATNVRLVVTNDGVLDGDPLPPLEARVGLNEVQFIRLSRNCDTWLESDDAGNTPDTAQITFGDGDLARIETTIGTETDTDVFEIRITDPDQFSVSMETRYEADTELYILNEGGFVAYYNEDLMPYSGLSGLGPGDFSGLPGRYRLAINLNNSQEVGAPVTGWTVNPSGSSPGLVKINLTGASFAVSRGEYLSEFESQWSGYELEWSGEAFGNDARATGRITIDESAFSNPGRNGIAAFPEVAISVSGANSGNGSFDLLDFSSIILDTGSLALNFATELIGQPTGQDPWGASQPGGTSGDFNLFRAVTSANAPDGSYYFELTPAGGERMLLTSFRPPIRKAISINFSSDLQTAALTPSESAGAPGWEALHWNNFDGIPSDNSSPPTMGNTSGVDSPIVGQLVQNDGSGLSTTVSWSSVNAGNANNGVSIPDNKLMSGYLDNDPGNPEIIRIDIADIPPSYRFFGYDVVVYFGSDGNDRTGRVWVSGSSSYSFDTDSSQGGGFPGAYLQTTDTGTGYPDANFAVFENLSKSEITIGLDRVGGNCGVHGIQIVANHPGPRAAIPAHTVLDTGGQVVPSPVTVASDGSATAWEWTPSEDGWYDINTFGSDFDTELKVYQGTTTYGLVCLAENDDAYPDQFSSDHPQPDRSAVILPLLAGATYQIVVAGGSNGLDGGSLKWQISKVDEPLPPAVETRTHRFEFDPFSYPAGTALIDTIVAPNIGSVEPYVHVVAETSAIWEGEGFDVEVRPYLPPRSSIRIEDAYQLTSSPRIPPLLESFFDGFNDPPSFQPGPFVTVVSARYPHPFGVGYRSLTVDMAASGGQGYGMTHVPFDFFGDEAMTIEDGEGGLKIYFEVPSGSELEAGYTLKDSMGNTVDSYRGTEAEQLIALTPGRYEIELDSVDGHRIVVSRDGLVNAVEEGNLLRNGTREVCREFPNEAPCNHTNDRNFDVIRSGNEVEVRPGLVTTVEVKYSALATGGDTLGHIDVSAVSEPFYTDDVLGTGSSMVESSLIQLPNSTQKRVLVLEPGERAPAGRYERWEKSAPWVEWRNFLIDGDSGCYSCHNDYGVPAPLLPFYKPVNESLFAEPFLERIQPSEVAPYVLGIFDTNVNHRMPVAITANGPGSPPRRTQIEYAGRKWEIQQEAGAGYVTQIVLDGSDVINLEPGARTGLISFQSSDQDYWYVDVYAPWIHLSSSDEGMGGGTLTFTVDPNPGSEPRIGTLMIGDVFVNILQGIDPPDVTSFDLLPEPRRMQFTVEAIPGLNYTLEFSENLTPVNWTAVAQGVGTAGEPSIVLEDPIPSERRTGFYRVRAGTAP
ncbi:hypothetical protein [Haloferula sp.]|uniref:hypothetical protein n=1 Tax=Haloferula sp. TaxID=2497595 RepID=UPI00329B5497